MIVAKIAAANRLLDADTQPVEFSPGHSTEAAIVRQGYGDVDAAMARAHRSSWSSVHAIAETAARKVASSS